MIMCGDLNARIGKGAAQDDTSPVPVEATHSEQGVALLYVRCSNLTSTTAFDLVSSHVHALENRDHQG
jgi:hypothetical protein